MGIRVHMRRVARHRTTWIRRALPGNLLSNPLYSIVALSIESRKQIMNSHIETLRDLIRKISMQIYTMIECVNEVFGSEVDE